MGEIKLEKTFRVIVFVSLIIYAIALLYILFLRNRIGFELEAKIGSVKLK